MTPTAASNVNTSATSPQQRPAAAPTTAQPISILRQPPAITTSDSMNQSPANEATVPQSPSAPPHLRIVPHFDSPRSLHFEPIERDVPEETTIKIGRFTDRVFMANRITFKSKVVSRGHAEIWTEGGKFYIRDTRSSSGTFLNHIRLSTPNQESRPFPLKDGDVIQLGVDYQGGTEEIYRCVKMRLELNRSWQHQLNPYCVSTFQNLRTIITPPPHNAPSNGESLPAAASALVNSSSIEDCCICLYAIAPFQALFVAPCSHSYHYKCIRPLLQNHPGFLCPLCRTYADLEASVAIEASEVIAKFGTREDTLPVQAEGTMAVTTATVATVTEDAADNGQDHDMADTAISSSTHPPASTARSDSPESDSGVTAPIPDAGNKTVVESATAIAETLMNEAFGLNPQPSSSRPIPINTNNRGNSSHSTTEHSTASPSTMVASVHPSFLSTTLLGSPSFSSVPPLPTNGSANHGHSHGHGHSRQQSQSQSRRDNSSPIVPNQSPTSERQGFGFFSHLTAPLTAVSTSTSATDDEDYMDVGEALSSSPPSTVVPISTERRGSTSGLVGKLKMIGIFEKKKSGPNSPVNTSPVQLNAPRVIVLAERSAIPKDSPTREARERGRDDDQPALASPSSVTSYLTSHDEESSSSSSSDGRPAELEDEEITGNSHAISSRKRIVRSSKGKAVNVEQIMEGVEQ